MTRKILKNYLLRIVPFFLLTLLAWHYLGFSKVYHTLIALSLDILYPSLDPTGFVQSVAIRGKEFVIHLLFHSKSMDLKIMADDLTVNTVPLIALFLSSPIKYAKIIYMINFAIALVVLFFIHVFTLSATVPFAFADNAEMYADSSLRQSMTWFLIHYTRFYELIGKYLIVLILWFPYIVCYLTLGQCVKARRKH